MALRPSAIPPMTTACVIVLLVVSIPLGAVVLAASLLTILPFSVVSAFFTILRAVLFLFLAVTVLVVVILLLIAKQIFDIIANIALHGRSIWRPLEILSLTD